MLTIFLPVGDENHVCDFLSREMCHIEEENLLSTEFTINEDEAKVLSSPNATFIFLNSAQGCPTAALHSSDSNR